MDATASETPDATEQRVRQIVAQFNADKPDIAARVIDCDPHLADTAQFVEAYGYTLGQSANTLIVIGKSDPPVYVACVVLGNTRLDVNKVVRKKLGAKKCSFAPAEMTEVALYSGDTARAQRVHAAVGRQQSDSTLRNRVGRRKPSLQVRWFAGDLALTPERPSR